MRDLILKALRKKEPRLYDWNGPFHVWSNMTHGVDSVRLHDDHFEVYSGSESAYGDVYHDGRVYIRRAVTSLHLITGSDHFLVSDEFRHVLEQCRIDSTEFIRAAVTDRVTRKPVTGYSELRPHDEITLTNLNQVDASGARAWRCLLSVNVLLVTKSVMLAIKKAHFYGLEFAPGLEAFLAGPAA